jgi:hypothetical protein
MYIQLVLNSFSRHDGSLSSGGSHHWCLSLLETIKVLYQFHQIRWIVLAWRGVWLKLVSSTRTYIMIKAYAAKFPSVGVILFYSLLTCWLFSLHHQRMVIDRFFFVLYNIDRLSCSSCPVFILILWLLYKNCQHGFDSYYIEKVVNMDSLSCQHGFSLCYLSKVICVDSTLDVI